MTIKQSIFNFFQALLVAVGYFVGSIYAFSLWYHDQPALAMFANIFMILTFLGTDKFFFLFGDLYTKNGKNKKLKHPLLRFLFRFTFTGVTVKTGLYLFYIVLAVCLAFVRVESGLYVLGDWKEYLEFCSYGLLILIASDKFLEQMFKDMRVKK